MTHLDAASLKAGKGFMTVLRVSGSHLPSRKVTDGRLHELRFHHSHYCVVSHTIKSVGVTKQNRNLLDEEFLFIYKCTFIHNYVCKLLNAYMLLHMNYVATQ